MAKTKTKLGEELDGKKIGFQASQTTKPTTTRDDSWKEELRSAYDTSAANQIKASDEAYDQAKGNADRQALSRGMQRSSYNNQTLANLDAKKNEAQQEIRANVDAAYNQAVLQQQNVYDQLDWQKEQAAQQQQNWQTQFDATQAQQNWQNQFQQSQFDYQQSQDQQAQANWQAQFDAQQAQQNWQNQFQQSQWDWQVAQANIANAAVSSGGSSGSGGYWDTRKPWEQMGISEQQYYALYGNGDQDSNGDIFGSTGGYWDKVSNYVSNTVKTRKG